jgi:heme/copper-type cytochrome/quinol oxidase subunit 1
MGFGAFMVGAWMSAVVISPAAASVDFDPLYDQWMWIGMGIAIGLPVLILLGGWADTLRRGRPRLHSSFLYAIAGIVVLLSAVAAGALLVIKPLELAGTTWEVGQADLVIWATVIAVVGGLHYWAPKLAGRQLGDGFGKGVLLLFLIGTGLLAGGNLAAGVPGEVDHVIVASSEGFNGVVGVSDTVEVANGAAALGGAILVLASFLVVVNILASSFVSLDEPLAGDPWDGHTLEWATASPPAHGNFDEVALVTSAAPLLDAREGDDDAGGADAPDGKEEG